MTSTIEIEQLKISCIVGIYPHEREHEQTLILDLRLEHDFADAARTQEIAKTMDELDRTWAEPTNRKNLEIVLGNLKRYEREYNQIREINKT